LHEIEEPDAGGRADRYDILRTDDRGDGKTALSCCRPARQVRRGGATPVSASFIISIFKH
jgi:hypothetical protein